ncbi:armadillo-type protein [Polychytrium aggregatum]|uniref:armadillo-type protein n=1 Tax=Polychytrium aggregatum TaxID=110093 RepID=UPI0022FE6B6F|nr:armadillo-type protein [Polychytrium aggregatum]KAI9197346.1 armadillo-type protein [Polychytrium aggregatum]
MHEILKHTLMGTGETTEPFVNPLGAVKVQRYPRKLGRRRGFRIDTSEANEPHDDDSKDFKLVLPSVLRDDDASTESGITTMFADSKMQPMTDSFTKYMDIPTQELEEAAAAPSDDADGTEAKSGDDLKVARAKSFRYVRKKEAQTSEWSLAFAVAMIKQRAMPRPKQKDESEGETQSNATSVIEELGDFLNTPYTEYPVVPEKHTPAYQAIFQTMMLALREGDRFLKYEAVRILVMMGAQFSTLGRWDNISFKAALHEMIRHGAEHQRFLAATTLCELDNVDEHVFRELQKGLGDVEEQRRNKSKAMLERMGTEYVHQVFSILVEESRNSSWRARRETVDLLEKWIHRLSPKAAVDSDGASEPAPGMNGNGSTNDPSNGPKGSNKAARPAPKPKPKPPPTEEEIKKQQERLEMIDRAVQILLDLMWNDWSTEVRNGSAQALGRLGRGRSVFDRIVHLLESNDPLRKIDALKALGSIGVMTKSAMDNYLACFVDSHHSVRIQACKVACVLATNNRQLVGALIDRFDDYDWRVRAYAVKAVGLSRCKESKIREALLYFLYHEPEAPVRVEAARSIGELGLLEIDAAFKDALVTVIETDKSEMVRKEAQAVLVQARAITTETIGGAPSGTSAPSSAGDRAAGHSGHPGHPGHPGHSGHSGHEPGDTQAHHPGGGGMFSSHPSATLTESNNTLSSMSSLRGSTLFPTAPTARPVPFPHILSGRSEAEVDIFLRDELVGEKEQRAVIEQVENMTTKGQVIAEVLQLDALSAYMEESGLDLVFGAEHSPMVHEIHHPRRRRPISLGLPEPQMRGGRRVPKIDYA